MKSLAVPIGRTGPLFSPAPPALGPVRRPTASPLRLCKLQSPFLGVTQQTSAPTQAPNDYDATEAAMRAAKERMAGNGTPTLPKPVIAEAEDLKAKFMKIQAEVSAYRALSVENGTLQDEIARLRQENEELAGKLSMQQEDAERAVNTARQEVMEPLLQQLEELATKVAAQQEELQRAVATARQETAEPLQQEVEALSSKFTAQQDEMFSKLAAQEAEMTSKLAAQQEEMSNQAIAQQDELKRAVEAARVEVSGPLQQQLEELAMQLQNSQAQLERLGEAVEAAEAEKATAVQALRDEKEHLLRALATSTSRLADVIYPAGSLPPGLTITTRLEGGVELDAILAQQAAAAAATAVPATMPPPTAEPASDSGSEDVAQPLKPVQPAPGARPVGFLARLFGVVCFWVYHVLGALLLYYAAAILAGAPPALTLEFGLGCLLVSSLLPWVNRMLVPRYST